MASLYSILSDLRTTQLLGEMEVHFNVCDATFVFTSPELASKVLQASQSLSNNVKVQYMYMYIMLYAVVDVTIHSSKIWHLVCLMNICTQRLHVVTMPPSEKG